MKIVLDTNVLLVSISDRSRLHYIEFITSYFRFQLLKDEDDDKFVDCAIAANAKFIVSHDKDFKVLKNISFPKVNVISTEEFAEEFNSK